jgi:polar amino acid transport system substrate-binding protein
MMHGRHGRSVLVALFAVLVLAACSSGGGGTGSSGGTGEGSSGGTTTGGDPNTDKLAQILARGTLVLSTDPKYPPQSFGVKGAARLSDTKCAENQLTANQIAGYDADTGKLLAAQLEVEPCFVVPSWTEITSGNWGDRWDISYGSGSINTDRMERLWMTQPYYAVPNYYFVAEDSPYQTASDLDGKTIGACASCSHEYYLRGELVIPGVDIVVNVKDPQIQTYNSEPSGLADVAKGKLDAFLCAEPVGNQAIDDGLALRMIPDLAFTYYPSGFVDKSSGLSSAAFVERVDQIIQAAEADGSLTEISMKYFGTDYATQAGTYDVSALDQNVT